MAKNFPAQGGTGIQIQKRWSQRPTQRHIVMNVSKVKHKERNLKASWEKQLVLYKLLPLPLSLAVILSADFSAETLLARKKWHDTFKVLKEKLPARILYLAKLFRINEEIVFQKSKS